jgi:hypothetical protein
MDSFKRQKSVSEPIASDTWTVKDGNGRKRTIRVEVGKPQPVPDDAAECDWFCPVFVEGFTGHVFPAMGVGPIESLMNAVTLIRSFIEHVGFLHIAPSSSQTRRRKR